MPCNSPYVLPKHSNGFVNIGMYAHGSYGCFVDGTGFRGGYDVAHGARHLTIAWYLGVCFFAVFEGACF